VLSPAPSLHRCAFERDCERSFYVFRFSPNIARVRRARGSRRRKIVPAISGTRRIRSRAFRNGRPIPRRTARPKTPERPKFAADTSVDFIRYACADGISSGTGHFVTVTVNTIKRYAIRCRAYGKQIDAPPVGTKTFGSSPNVRADVYMRRACFLRDAYGVSESRAFANRGRSKTNKKRIIRVNNIRLAFYVTNVRRQIARTARGYSAKLWTRDTLLWRSVVVFYLIRTAIEVIRGR